MTRKTVPVLTVVPLVLALPATAMAATLPGTVADDTLRGTSAADVLYGKGGNDSLFGYGDGTIWRRLRLWGGQGREGPGLLPRQLRKLREVHIVRVIFREGETSPSRPPSRVPQTA